MGRFDRLLRRRATSQPAPAAPAPDMKRTAERLDALEAMVEALQDSVDRQATRHDERINELARQMQPSELARALSEDARRRGL
jgi:hypothetical protein